VNLCEILLSYQPFYFAEKLRGLFLMTAVKQNRFHTFLLLTGHNYISQVNALAKIPQAMPYYLKGIYVFLEIKWAVVAFH